MDTREYELMYIVRPTVAEDEFNGFTERVDTMITNLGGEVQEKQPWGKRRLAYPIEKHEDGYYVVAKVRLDPNRVQDLEEQLRITDDVLRHIVVTPGEPARPPKETNAAPEEISAEISDESIAE